MLRPRPRHFLCGVFAHESLLQKILVHEVLVHLQTNKQTRGNKSQYPTSPSPPTRPANHQNSRVRLHPPPPTWSASPAGMNVNLGGDFSPLNFRYLWYEPSSSAKFTQIWLGLLYLRKPQRFNSKKTLTPR